MSDNGKTPPMQIVESGPVERLSTIVERLERYARAKGSDLEPVERNGYVAFHVLTAKGKLGRVAFGAGYNTPSILGPYFKFSGSEPPAIRISGYQPIRETPRYNQLEYGPLRRLEDLALFEPLFVHGYDTACG